MDLIIRREILNDKRLKCREKVVLATIELIFALDSNLVNEGWLTQKNIEILCGIPVVAVKYSLGILCKNGIIEIIGENSGTINKYDKNQIIDIVRSINQREQLYVRIIGV